MNIITTKSSSTQPNAVANQTAASDHQKNISDFLRHFIPAILIICLAAFLLVKYDHDNRRRMQEEAIGHNIQLAVNKIDLTFRSILSDLRYLAGRESIIALADGDGSVRAALSRDLLSFSRHKKRYDQVRFLNADGKERVRINFNAGAPTIVTDDALQNKRGRYYFDDTLSLQQGEVFISPLDLNIERGTVEKPFKPMIRFGMPIFGSDGERKGIVLFNYLAEQLLNEFRGLMADGEGELSLLNQDGHWLSGPDPAMNWGFMFPENIGLTFDARFPRTWRKIATHRSGTVRNREGRFVYATVYPLNIGRQNAIGTNAAAQPGRSNIDTDDYLWKVVIRQPPPPWLETTDSPLFWGLTGLAVIGAAIGAWFRTQYRQQLRQTMDHLRSSRSKLEEQVAVRTRELWNSHEELNSLLASTGEALYGIDTLGRCTFANRACVELLGYKDEDRLLGRNMHLLIHHSHADGTPYAVADCPIFRAFHQGEGEHRDDEVLWCADGSSFPAEYRSRPVERDGEVVGAVVTFNDISQRKEAEEALRESKEKYRLLVENQTDLMVKVDPQGRFLFVSPSYCRLFGKSEEDLLGKTFMPMVHEDDRKATNEAMEALFSPPHTAYVEQRAMTKDGWTWLGWMDTAIVDDEGKVTEIIGVGRDIGERVAIQTEKDRALHALGERVKELQCVFGVAEAIRTHVDLEGIFSSVLRIIPTGWRYPQQTEVRILFDGKTFSQTAFHDTPWKQSGDLVLQKRRVGAVEVFYTEPFPDRDEGPFLIQERNLLNNIAGLLSEAIERQRAEAELKHLATHDPLTGLFNRKMLERRLADEVARANRYGRTLSVFMLDIDHFKLVNDTFGHQAGDQVLHQFAQLVAGTVRQSDYAARYGGEEFVVILPETPLNEALSLAERLRQRIAEQPLKLNDGKELEITASIGVCAFPEQSGSWGEILEAADAAMYSAKKNGRNRVQAA